MNRNVIAMGIYMWGCMFLLMASEDTLFEIDKSKEIGRIGYLYNIGYDGWGDICKPAMIQAFGDVGVRYCRIKFDLSKVCGKRPGEFDWNQMSEQDSRMDFIARLRQIQSNNWVPLIAFSYHGGVGWLPPWFHGEKNDERKDAWTRYNIDGTKVSRGYGDQLKEATKIAEAAVAYLVSKGFRGMRYETMYEMGADMPLPEIHQAVASGIRKADRDAFIMGPATWPGWTLEEKFIKPYLEKYGPKLLDGVSAHWYGTSDHPYMKLMKDHGDDILTMDDTAETALLMKNTVMYGKWVSTAAALLRDRKLNPSHKKIGISFTEIDVDAISYYLRNPENPRWPKYSESSDCWLNGNYFGGVWWASVLGNIAAAGEEADAFKFAGRNYYGLQDMAGERAYRYPVWFAFRLLGGSGGFSHGREMVEVSRSGDEDDMLEVFANAGSNDLRVLVINKSQKMKTIELSGKGLELGRWKLTRFTYDQTRVAHFQGKKPGGTGDGTFEGYPESDRASEPCLTPSPVRILEINSRRTSPEKVECPAVSFQIFTFEKMK